MSGVSHSQPITIEALLQRIEALERRIQALEAERQEAMDARRNADMRMRGAVR